MLKPSPLLNQHLCPNFHSVLSEDVCNLRLLLLPSPIDSEFDPPLETTPSLILIHILRPLSDAASELQRLPSIVLTRKSQNHN
jgi:hypothetical protein